MRPPLMTGLPLSSLRTCARRLLSLGGLLALVACGDKSPETPGLDEPAPPVPPVPGTPVPEAVEYPDSLLCPESASADARCGTPYASASAMTDAELQTRYAAGLEAWRYEGARMFIFLVEEDLRKTGEVYDRDEVLYAVRFMRTWIQRLEGAEDPAINAQVVSIEPLAKTARELRTAVNRTENPGTGLQPTGRWAEFATPYTG